MTEEHIYTWQTIHKCNPPEDKERSIYHVQGICPRCEQEFNAWFAKDTFDRVEIWVELVKILDDEIVEVIQFQSGIPCHDCMQQIYAAAQN